MELKENTEYADLSIHSIIEGESRHRDKEEFKSAGFSEQEVKDGEFVSVDGTEEEDFSEPTDDYDKNLEEYETTMDEEDPYESDSFDEEDFQDFDE